MSSDIAKLVPLHIGTSANAPKTLTLAFCGNGIAETEFETLENATPPSGPPAPYAVQIGEVDVERARRLAPMDVGRLPDLHCCQLGPGSRLRPQRAVSGLKW